MKGKRNVEIDLLFLRAAIEKKEFSFMVVEKGGGETRSMYVQS